jgi:membrane protease YdiL (CAAX protease family)
MRVTVRQIEFCVLFVGLPVFFGLVRIPGGPIPLLIVLGPAAYWYLRRRPDLDRRDLTRPEALRAALPSILGLWSVAALVAVLAIALFLPGWLFNLPRQQPWLWAAVVVFYPLVSVYPQELLFRAFLLYRYAPVFGTGTRAAAASAVAFGLAHLMFHNVWSVALTLVGGWLFARRYQRTRSLLTASVEHALYGVLAFTVGLGALFYHGAVH